MKTSFTAAFSFVLACFQIFAVFGFTTVTRPPSYSVSTQRHMFGGAGAGSPTEDDPEQEAAIAAGAAAMNMSSDEYKLAMRAREQLVKMMDSKIVESGNADTIMIERDVNNPPKKFEVTITDAGKELGREILSKEIVKALDKCKIEAAKGRQEAQQEMLKWVQSQST
mmetsp:Transcript_61584/g.70765  ORF Transcript_61584/g.70765 Transcript_61584/m.70765 type:complete len:167 (-) Transcript_61584:192-692(-)